MEFCAPRFAAAVDQAMRARRLSQVDLVVKSGVPQSTISRILSGRGHAPRIDTMLAIEAALSCPPLSLVSAAVTGVDKLDFSEDPQLFKAITNSFALNAEQKEMVIEIVQGILRRNAR